MPSTSSTEPTPSQAASQPSEDRPVETKDEGPPAQAPPAKTGLWGVTQRVVSVVALAALAPVFALLWVLVKATSPGPFIVARSREGLGGAPFQLYKIRTVRTPEPYAVVRQTPLGTILRTLKLDELPQLWNVAKGELAWVGPRPLPMGVARRLARDLPGYTQRQRVLPGLTNLGSISTIYDESRADAEPNFHRLIESDHHYIRNRSVSYDLVAMVLTGFYVVRQGFRSLLRTTTGGRKRTVAAQDNVTRELETWLTTYEGRLTTRQSSALWKLAQRGIALMGMVCALPIFAFMYIGVKITSPGPFLFCQSRRGFLGKPFRIYKVRTLSVGSEKKTALGVQNGDSSVTRFGGMLRALKLDELPQLYNVLRGDMELVGPRPIPMALEDKLLEHIPDFGMRHLVHPGLTNVGQVSVMDNELNDRLIADWTLRAESERHYVAHKGLAYDLVMVVLTSLYIGRKFISRQPKTKAAEVAGPTATRVIGTPIANLGYDGVLDVFRGWIGNGSPHRTVNICPVHSLIEGKFSADHRHSLEEADLNTADGMPVVWAKRILGDRQSSRVYGPTLMMHVLEEAETEGWRIGLFGGHPERLPLLESNLLERFPKLKIEFSESPPFRELSDEEEDSLRTRMNEAELDVVWVGLGCPKQERWMREHREHIQGIFVGVGAAFDFHAGKLRQAPSWMQATGLEWLFRLACEPRRLFGRYAKTNPTFITLFGLQVLGRVLRRKSYREPLELGLDPATLGKHEATPAPASETETRKAA